jgi:nitrite reductase/ring-hydroxylating ferredoxin subunit
VGKKIQAKADLTHLILGAVLKSSGKRETPKKKGYIFVGYKEEIDPEKPVTVRLMGKPVTLFKRGDDLFAREMACKHQGADLSSALIRGDLVTCSRHGWQYDILTGQCQNQDSPPLRSHHVATEGEAVFVALFPGDPPID